MRRKKARDVKAAREVVKEAQRGSVREMAVIDREEERPPLGEVGDEPVETVKHGVIGIAARPGGRLTERWCGEGGGASR